MPITYNKIKGNFVATEEQSGINDYTDTSVSHPNRAPAVGRSEAKEGTVLNYFDDTRGDVQSVGHGGYLPDLEHRQVAHPIEDFFEVTGVGLQAKSGAYAGGATFTEYADAIEEAAGTTGGGSCVLPGTKVITKRGEINIEDTKEDDMIFVFDFAEETFDYSPINSMRKGTPVKGWTELETEMGYKL